MRAVVESRTVHLMDAEGTLTREEPHSTSRASDKEPVEISKYFHIFLHSFTFSIPDAKRIKCGTGY